MTSPTQAELEILNVLWEAKEATVQTVNTKLNELRPIGYTTTLKSMQLMAQKGWLDRRLEGRSHIYFPLIQEDETKSGMLSRFVQATFGGSTSRLMMQLLGNKTISKQEAIEIRNYLKNIEERDND